MLILSELADFFKCLLFQWKSHENEGEEEEFLVDDPKDWKFGVGLHPESGDDNDSFDDEFPEDDNGLNEEDQGDTVTEFEFNQLKHAVKSVQDGIFIEEADDLICFKCGARTYLPAQYAEQNPDEEFNCNDCMVAKSGHENCEMPSCYICQGLAIQIQRRLNISRMFVDGTLAMSPKGLDLKCTSLNDFAEDWFDSNCGNPLEPIPCQTPPMTPKKDEIPLAKTKICEPYEETGSIIGNLFLDDIKTGRRSSFLNPKCLKYGHEEASSAVCNLLPRSLDLKTTSFNDFGEDWLDSERGSSLEPIPSQTPPMTPKKDEIPRAKMDICDPCEETVSTIGDLFLDDTKTSRPSSSLNPKCLECGHEADELEKESYCDDCLIARSGHDNCEIPNCPICLDVAGQILKRKLRDLSPLSRTNIVTPEKRRHTNVKKMNQTCPFMPSKSETKQVSANADDFSVVFPTIFNLAPTKKRFSLCKR